MNREFLLNILFLLTINLLVKPFYIFGIDRNIQNTVGEGEYGLYATLFDFTFLFYILNDIGLQQFNSRTISQNNSLINSYLPNLLTLKVILASTYLIIIFIAAILIYPPDYYPIIFYVSINHVLISFVFFLRTNISGLGMYRTDSMISALDKLLLIIVCTALLWGNLFDTKFRIEWFIWAQTLTWSLTALIAFLVLRKKVHKWFLKFDIIFWKSILKKSYPFALVFLLMTVYTRVDKVMIERMLSNGTVEAGIYTAGYRLLDASNMIGFLFAGLLLPMFSAMLKRKENVQDLVDLSFKMIIAGAMTVAISCWFFRSEIMFLLYDNATVYYGEVMGFLMLSFIAVSGIYIYSTLLTANANLKKMNWLFLISIVLNVVLNIILIQKSRAEGAAIATFITQFFVLFGTMFLSNVELGIKIRIGILLKIFIFGLAFFLFGMMIPQIELPWKVKFLMCIAFGISSSFFLKLVNLNTLFDLLSKRRKNGS